MGPATEHFRLCFCPSGEKHGGRKKDKQGISYFPCLMDSKLTDTSIQMCLFT